MQFSSKIIGDLYIRNCLIQRGPTLFILFHLSSHLSIAGTAAGAIVSSSRRMEQLIVILQEQTCIYLPQCVSSHAFLLTLRAYLRLW